MKVMVRVSAVFYRSQGIRTMVKEEGAKVSEIDFPATFTGDSMIPSAFRTVTL